MDNVKFGVNMSGTFKYTAEQLVAQFGTFELEMVIKMLEKEKEKTTKMAVQWGSAQVIYRLQRKPTV
jgi:serine kinase of HPr protein (carbohydrate metabolism regulator)